MNYKLRSNRDKSLSITEQVFMNRGIAPQNVYHYLHTSQQDILDPMLLDNMREGAQMLIQHIAANDLIYMVVDSDADGFTSSALLLNYLNRLFPKWTQKNITYVLHEGKQHGLNDQNLEDITKSYYKLVICADSSSNDYEAHKYLHENGIDILILDHHEAEKVSENACVINNQLSNYPNKTLSGVGVVYKFCCYIDSLLKKNIANDFLDLVAIGMIADMMDLRDLETKALITEGLRRIQNPHIQSRCEANSFSIGDQLTPFGVSFYVAPLINAINRSGTQEEKILTFESMLEYKANNLVPSTKRGYKGQVETLVTQAIRVGNNVKNRQTRNEEAAREKIELLIEKNNLLDNKILTICIPKKDIVDSSLTGLIANQIANKYMRPTLILNETDHEGEIWWEGSGRNFANSPLEDFRVFVQETGEVQYAEGHESAFGCGIKDENLISFLNKTNDLLKNVDFTAQYLVDFIYDRSDSLNLKNTILELGNLKEHWGQGVEEPLILIKGIKLTSENITLYEKGPTLKLTIPGDEGIEMLKFRSTEEEYESLYSSSGCVEINVIGTCELNSWHGFTKPQITIKDYEIVGKTAYYF